MKYRLGIDLGGTNIAVVLLNLDDLEKQHKGIIARAHGPTPYTFGYDAVVADIARLCFECLKKVDVDIEDVAYAGIGAPGVVDREKGILVYSSNLKFKQVPLAESLSKLLKIPVYLDNDANLAALGEMFLGAAQGSKNAVIITLGTGIGGGVFVEGKLMLGFNDGAGELGHHVIKAKGRPCTCGRQGCWETYSSARGLLQTCNEIILDYPASSLWQHVDAKGQIKDCPTIFAAYDQGDLAAQRIIEEYLQMLTIGLANIVNLFQPEVIALSGGLSNRSDILLPNLQSGIAKEVYAYRQLPQTKIIKALLGNDAGLFGAALLKEI